ncbi:MAG: hypothetical protein GY937_20195 [bacterium]|nr:hypothetical protein [bacterium]
MAFVSPLQARENARQRKLARKQAHTVTPEEAEAYNFVEERWRPTDTAKRALEKQWFINIGFLAGYHYHYWSDHYGGLVYRSDVPRWRIRQPFNKIIEYVEQRHSTLLTSTPELRVRPKTADEDDFRAANLGDKVLRHYWEFSDMDSQRQEFVRWLVTCGTAFYKVTWDASVGDMVDVPQFDQKTELPLYDRDGTPITKAYHQGDIRTEVVSPFQMYIPNAATWEDTEWAIQVTERPLEWVYRQYPDKADLIERENVSNIDEARHYERTLLNLIGPSGFRHGVESTPGKGEFVTVKEMWLRAGGSEEFEEGRKVVIAGSTVCENDENPYGEELPFCMAKDIMIPGRLWGQSVIDHLIPEQRVYNRVIGKFLECLILHGHPKVLINRQSNVPDSALTSEPGERVEYNGAMPPSYMNPPAFAESAYRFLLETVERAMDHTSVSFSASRGMASQRMSGIALAQLIEQDVRDMTPPTKRVAYAHKDWGRQVLKVVHPMVGENRILRLFGTDKRWEVTEWTGADLRGHSDVYVDPSSAIPKNKALALQISEVLVKSGIKNPMDPADRAWLHHYLELEDTALAFDTSEVDDRLARQENLAAKRGFPLPMPRWHENHIIHVALHREALQTDTFRDDPQLTAFLEQHLQLHHMMMMGMQQAQGKPGENGKEESQEGSSAPSRDLRDRGDTNRQTNPDGGAPGAAPAPYPAGPTAPMGPMQGMDTATRTAFQ